MKQQPQHQREAPGKQDAGGRDGERRIEQGPRGLRGCGIGMLQQVPPLPKYVPVQVLKRFGQPGPVVQHGPYGRSFFEKGRVGTGEMMADQQIQAALMIPVGDLLKRQQIIVHLIELTGDALTILCDKARQRSPG